MAHYLSIIIPSGNDVDWYVKDALHKTEYCLKILIEQLTAVSLSTEIIVVDWNNNPDKPPLSEKLKVSSVPNYISLQFIKVPQEYHRRYLHWNKRGTHISVASNVGITRASGSFIVCKSQDSLFSPSLIKFLAKKELQSGFLYRCNRSDVEFNSNVFEKGAESIFEYCRQNITHTYYPTKRPIRFNRTIFPFLHTDASGDFQLMSAHDFNNLRGYEETPSVFALHSDTTLAYCAHACGIIEERLPMECCVFKFEHDNVFRKRIKIRYLPSILEGKLVSKTIYAHGEPLGTWNQYLEKIYYIVTGKESAILNSPDWGLNETKFSNA